MTRVRLLVVTAATLGTAAAVAVSGLIGFVGILVPHAIRLLAGGGTAWSFRCRRCSAPRSWWLPTSSPARRRTRRTSHRRGHGLHRRAVLRGGAPDDADGGPMIRLESATVRLDGVPVDTADLAVAAGEWVMLIGRNGAGKTSLLRAVAGLVPYDGSVTVGGREVASLGPRQRARGLAMVPQTPVVPLDMTVADYALLGRTPHLGFLGRPGQHDYEAAGRALDSLGLAAMAGGGWARSAVVSDSEPCWPGSCPGRTGAAARRAHHGAGRRTATGRARAGRAAAREHELTVLGRSTI